MTVLELFAGGGGAAMGLHRAGLHTLARCEWDKDACATLRAAAEAGFLDAATVIEGDVRTVDWSPYVGKVDVLWASPPCQAWSSAGKRLGASDDRNGWPWTWDVCDKVRPTWLLAENVTGLLMHRGDCDGKGAPADCPACYWHRHILPEARKRFASVQWAVLNSSAFGVPQHRRRVYLVCGPRPIAWPKATHGDPAEIRQGGLFAAPLLPWVTVREALDLDAALRPERGQGMQERHGVRRDHPPTEPAPQIGAGSAGSGPRLQVVADASIIYRRGRETGAVDETHGVDEPSCALRGAPGGSSQPFIAEGRAVTRSRNGQARIEYPLSNPKMTRGPSDLVRRHPVESDDAPASTVGALRPTFLLSERDQRERVLPLDAPARTVKAGGQTDASGHMGGHAALFVIDPKHPPVELDGLATAIRSGGSGHSAPPMWLRTEMTGAVAAPVDVPAGTVPKSGNQYLHASDPGVRNGPATRPELLDSPSPSIMSREVKGTTVTPTTGERRASDVQCASDVLFLGAGIRRLTVTECALLMSWPADYPLKGTKTSQYRIVGNGVTPPVSQLLGKAIMEAHALQASQDRR